jgi:hypothetical protein
MSARITDISRVVGHAWPARSGVGITEYLNTQFPYERPQIRARGSKHGLSYGRRFHTQIHNAVRTNTWRRLPVAARGVYYYFQFLQQIKLIPTKTEMTIANTRIGVNTKVDLVCTDKNGVVVMIENKTTRHSFADYMRIYHQKTRVNPDLVNGLANTEYTRHQLQAAFAVHTINSNVPQLRVKVRGAVIVCCRDRYAIFWTPISMTMPAIFPSCINV